MAENETPSGGLLDQREALVAVARAMWDVLPDEYDSVTCTAMVMGGFGEYQQQAHSTEDSKVIGASYPLIKAVTEPRPSAWFALGSSKPTSTTTASPSGPCSRQTTPTGKMPRPSPAPPSTHPIGCGLSFRVRNENFRQLWQAGIGS